MKRRNLKKSCHFAVRLQKVDKLLEAHSIIYGYPYTKNQAFMQILMHKRLILVKTKGSLP